jgi:hypothetical protein
MKEREALDGGVGVTRRVSIFAEKRLRSELLDARKQTLKTFSLFDRLLLARNAE